MSHPNGRKPPNPQKAPKSHGKKPPAPGAHTNRGNSGCAVVAFGALGAAIAATSGVGYAAWQVIF